jgi:AraC-like DNA-binding protein
LAPERLRDPAYRVETPVLLRLFAGAEARSGDPLIGLHVAERIRYGGLATSLLSSQNTLAEAVRTQSRFQALLLGANSVSMHQRGSLTHVTLNAGSPPSLVRHLTEYCVASSCRLMRWLTLEAARPDEVHFRHRPAGAAAEYERVFACPVRFDMSENGALLSGAALAAPLLSANEQLTPQLETLARAEIEARAPIALRDAVIAALRVAWREGTTCRREVIARRLGISARTLQRRLEGEGTSFAQVLDETRREAALALLADPAYSVGTVSRGVGYADQFAFNKAFRRWTGRSPSAYRRELLQRAAR